MVHLRAAKQQPSSDAVAAVLAVGQRAQQRLPDEDAPLADRLFALECGTRAQTAGAATVERYRPALRDVDWWLDEQWEPDVTHTVILAQALSASAALGLTTPIDWRDKLVEALEVLEKRRTKIGLGHDPALLAAVLRGLAASETVAPPWLLQAAEAALDEYAAVEGFAELADALIRVGVSASLVAKAVNAVFGGADATDHDAAYARWWLAGRQPDLRTYLSPSVLADARLQAIASADPFEPKAAAMLMEVAFCQAGALIIGTEQEVADARASVEKQLRINKAVYRGLFFAALVIGVLLDVHAIARDIAPKGGIRTYRHLIVAVCFALLSYCVTATAESWYEASGKQTPRWTGRFEALIALIAAIVGAWAG